MRNRFAAAFAAWLGISLAAFAGETSGNEAVLFHPDGYLRHVQFLADDARGGRYPGDPGIAEAEEYIAEWFERSGLEPGGPDDSWFQYFELERTKLQNPDAARLLITASDESNGSAAPLRSAEYGTDYVAFPFSMSGAVSGPLAFVGYGISAEEYDFDDYADFDATGKVLLMIRHEPLDDDPEAIFGGTPPSSHAMFVRKARIASERGAAGVLIVNSPRRDEGDPLYTWSARESRNTYELPMLHVSQAYADELLARAGKPPLAELVDSLDRDRRPRSADLGLHCELDPAIGFTQARNVIARLRGASRPDEYVVVGAHHDHVGMGRDWRGGSGSVVHNGADDNASGTAGVLELARAFARGPRPSRSIIFMTFSAEEMGLIGSRYFCDNPTVPIESIRAMINLDMIGRLSQDRMAIYGTSTAVEFDDILARANESLGLSFSTPRSTGGIFNQSDHANFYRKDIPVLFPFTGLHPEYHRPPDDWELIDPRGATRVVQLAYNVISELAEMSDGPTFTRGPAREESSTEQPSEQMPRVRLGIVPSYEDESAGLLIDEVAEGSAAADAGLRDGDRIMKIGDREIRGIREYMRAARRFQPGDETVLSVQRGGQTIELTVRFAGVRDPQPAETPAEPADSDQPTETPEPQEAAPAAP